MRLSSATSLFAVLLLLLSVLCFLGAEAHSARRRRGAAEQEPSKVGSFVRHGKSLMASLMGSSSSSEGAEGENEDGGDGEASVEDASEGEEKAKPPPPQVDGITPKRKSGVPSDDPEVDRTQRDIPPHEQQHQGRPPPIWQQQPPPFMPGGFPRGPPQHPRPPHMMMQQPPPPPPPNYPQRFPHSQRLNYDWFQGPVNVDQIFRDLRFTPPPPSSSSSYPGRRPTTVSTTSRKQMAPNKPLYPNMFEDTREAVPNRRHVSFGAR